MTVDEIKAILDGDRPIVVVRCKDCRYYQDAKINTLTEHDRVCAYALFHRYYREPNDYCSKGERRKDGADDE